jgi:hypothetical protein
MINPFTEINWSPDTEALRAFGKSLIIGGAILALVTFGLSKVWDATHWKVLNQVFLIMIPCGVVFMIVPILGKPIYYVWYFLAACIGFVISNVILVAFYYLFFSVIALVIRTTGRDPLQLKKPSQGTWSDHQKPDSKSRYYRQY